MAFPYTPTWAPPALQQFAPSTAQPVQPVVMPSVQPTNGIIKVSGRESAAAYLMPPNSTSPALFDTNGKTFYIKTTDGAGVGTVEAFDFSEHVEEAPQPTQAPVTREEFDGLAAKVDAIFKEQADVQVPTAVRTADPAPAKHAGADDVATERAGRQEP